MPTHKSTIVKVNPDENDKVNTDIEKYPLPSLEILAQRTAGTMLTERSFVSIGVSKIEIPVKGIFTWCAECKNQYHTKSDKGEGQCFTCMRLTLATHDIDIPKPVGFD